MNIAFIVQARSGSTRLPNKMNMPFYENQNILDIILNRLKTHFKDIPFILATTVNIKDDAIVETGTRNQVEIYRGSEDNVLSRFVEASKQFSVKHVIRICADNPFISVKYLEELIQFYQTEKADYVSFISENGLPAMKTHYGFFTEITSFKTLEMTAQKTQDPFYCEHVTNFIYGNPDLFSLNFIKIPSEIENANIRLTVDTMEDFIICKEIYSYLMLHNFSVEPAYIIKYINDNPDFLSVMKDQINLNKK
jgi:spore coat polysaccharide biosynthesis protein SpsF (cytidylyltransferase family)